MLKSVHDCIPFNSAIYTRTCSGERDHTFVDVWILRNNSVSKEIGPGDVLGLPKVMQKSRAPNSQFNFTFTIPHCLA